MQESTRAFSAHDGRKCGDVINTHTAMPSHAMPWQVGVFIAAMMQGLLIVGFRLLTKAVSRILNDKENWKTEAQYSTALYSKLFAFGCINSYSALFFFAFMSNDFNWFGLLDFDLSCPDRDCFAYVGLLAVVLFVQLCIIKFLPKMIAFFTKCLSTDASDQKPEDAPQTPSLGCKCTKCMARELSEDEKAAQTSMLLPSFQCQLTKEKDKVEGAAPPETLDDHFFDTVMDLGMSFPYRPASVFLPPLPPCCFSLLFSYTHYDMLLHAHSIPNPLGSYDMLLLAHSIPNPLGSLSITPLSVCLRSDARRHRPGGRCCCGFLKIRVANNEELL